MGNLIVYFSHAGENWVNGKVVHLPEGNTFRAAKIIRDAVGGELFEVQAKVPYPTDYQALLTRTKDELDSGARPELAAYPDTLEGIGLIFVGYPNWWNTMPAPMVTFLTKASLAGKQIAPFCTNEGGSMGMGEREMTRLCPGAEILPGLSIHGADVGTEKEAARIREWALKIAQNDR